MKKMTTNERAFQHFVSMVEAHQLNQEQVYNLGNKQRMVYAIIDVNGNIHALRKSYGGANRALKTDRFCFFTQLMEEGATPSMAHYYTVLAIRLDEVVEHLKKNKS